MDTSIATSLLSIIQDGMDQAKFRMPRVDPRARRSKLLDRLYRPTMHVVCTWVHGHSISFFQSEEDVRKNSVTSTEATAIALSDVLNQVGRLPLTLHCQHDNTYREAKNRWYLSFHLLLAALGIFRSTVVSFLRPGHSRFVW